MFTDNKNMVGIFQDWLGLSIDSTLDTLNNAWEDRNADILAMYDLTQRSYKARGITSITVYRGCTENMGDIAPLSSWTRDHRLAKEYLGMDRNNIHNIVIIKVVPVSDVLFDTLFIDYYFEDADDVLGMMPCDELILIRTK